MPIMIEISMHVMRPIVVEFWIEEYGLIFIESHNAAAIPVSAIVGLSCCSAIDPKDSCSFYVAAVSLPKEAMPRDVFLPSVGCGKS